jgi:hypothetical protein
VTMPDANTFASIGFTNVSDHFARPYPESAIPTDDWPFFYMVERAYPFTMMQLALSCVVLTIPLFFAGIIFSSLIGEARINISTAFAYNLMGALFGGVMEYNSMYFGFAFLYLLALGFYVLAWAFSWRTASPVRAGTLITPSSSVP